MLGVVIRNFVSDAWVSEVVFTIQNVIGIWNWKVLLPGPSIFMRQNNALLETSWSLYWLLHQLNYPPDLVSQISEVDMVPASEIDSIGMEHWAVLKTTSIWLALAVSWWYLRGTRSTFIVWRWNQPFLDRSPWSLPRLKQHNPLLFQTMSWAPGQLDCVQFVICSIVMDFSLIARCNEMWASHLYERSNLV